MKILSIVWYKILPPEYGGQKGIALFNKYLSQHLPLVCLCSKDNEIENPFFKVVPLLPVNKFQFVDPFIKRKIISIVKKEKPTHIIIEHPYYGFAGLSAAKRAGAKFIVHSHNIESERFRKMGKWWWLFLRKYEKWVHQNADLSLFKTKEDLIFAIEHFGLKEKKCMILPYGIDPERKQTHNNAKQIIWERHKISTDEKMLLFSGTLDYQPNAKAVESIFKKIAPQLSKHDLRFKIVITGRNQKRYFQYLSRLSHPNVVIAGEVKDIENYLAAADVFINPVVDCEGIQTKVIDALSYDLNVVCFRNALRGIDVSLCNEKVFVADENNFKNFSEKIMEAFLSNHSPTPEAFIQSYSFRNHVEKFVARLNSL